MNLCQSDLIKAKSINLNPRGIRSHQVLTRSLRRIYKLTTCMATVVSIREIL